MAKHYYWDVTLHGEGKSAKEAWEFALEGFMQAKIPCPKPSLIETEDGDGIEIEDKPPRA